MLIIPAELEEKKPMKLADRPWDERREFQDKIGQAVMEYRQSLELPEGADPGDIQRLYRAGWEAVEKLLNIAAECGYSPLWVYNKLTSDSRLTINMPVLCLIQRIKGYKKGWLHFIKQQIERRAG